MTTTWSTQKTVKVRVKLALNVMTKLTVMNMKVKQHSTLQNNQIQSQQLTPQNLYCITHGISKCMTHNDRLDFLRKDTDVKSVQLTVFFLNSSFSFLFCFSTLADLSEWMSLESLGWKHFADVWSGTECLPLSGGLSVTAFTGWERSSLSPQSFLSDSGWEEFFCREGLRFGWLEPTDKSEPGRGGGGISSSISNWSRSSSKATNEKMAGDCISAHCWADCMRNREMFTRVWGGSRSIKEEKAIKGTSMGYLLPSGNRISKVNKFSAKGPWSLSACFFMSTSADTCSWWHLSPKRQCPFL